MENSSKILTELLEIAPELAKEGVRHTPFSIPPGYFEDFTDILMNRMQLEQDLVLSADEEIASLSPLLAGLQKKNPYHVPDGFFHSLDVNIQSPVRKSGVLSMSLRVVRYAAAACIIAMIGTASFQVFNHPNKSDPLNLLTTVSDQDMANFLDSDDVHWTPGSSSLSGTASVVFSDNEIHELLSNVPDDELIEYASSLPTEKRTVN